MMRKVLFWLMIVVLLGLGVIFGIAMNKHTSPKALVKSRFTRSHSGQLTSTQTSTTISGTHITTGIMTGNVSTGGTTVATSGELSQDDKKQVQNLLDSVVETN